MHQDSDLSTVKRPDDYLIQRFRPSFAGPATVRSHLADGFSLVICCKRCPRVIEWTPPELLERFKGNLGLKVSELATRLSCAGEDGCGSREIAVFPHFYDKPWTWPQS